MPSKNAPIDHELSAPSFDWKESMAWWEGRRLYFNLIVGAAGVLGCLLFMRYFFPVMVIEALLYGVVANVFYSLGFFLEALDQFRFGGQLRMTANRGTYFGFGVVLSVAVTLLLTLVFAYMMPFNL